MRTLRKYFYYLTSILKMIWHIKNWPILAGIFLNRKKKTEQSLRLRFSPLRLIVRGAMDAWAVKETFIDQFYTRYGEPVQDEWVVVDIGAGIGDYAIHAAYGNPKARIYAFEPFPSSYQLLIKNLTVNAIDNVFAFQQAVWKKDGKITLDLSGGEPLQISSQENSQIVDGHKVIEVEAISLKHLLSRENLTQIDMLKLDCEGAEYEILMTTPPEILHKVKRIIMEYHDIDKGHHHGMLADFLTSRGYVVTKYRNFVHGNVGYFFAELSDLSTGKI